MAAELVAGDTNAAVRVRFRHRDGRIYPLIDVTVTIKFRCNDGALITQPCVILDEDNGLAQYAFAAGELIAGTIYMEFEISDVTLVLSSSDVYAYTVRAKV